jgi:hypothetical protein
VIVSVDEVNVLRGIACAGLLVPRRDNMGNDGYQLAGRVGYSSSKVGSNVGPLCRI